MSYLNRAGHSAGHGVHSPFVFDLITNVIEQKHPYYAYAKIESLRERILSNDTEVFVDDFGTGKSGFRKLSKIAKRSLKSAKEAQLLHRLAVASAPQNIVELGTSLGLTTAYLASVNSKIPCYSLEASPELLKIASQTLQNCGFANVTLLSGDILSTLPLLLSKISYLGFVFFDANHTKEATLVYFKLCIPKINKDTVFVFDDIHSTKGMDEAWGEIISHPQVRLSLDLYSFGVVYFNTSLNKQHYVYLKR